MTSLLDIAKLTGFSKSTVSRALSGNGYVSPNTQRQILEVANRLDYTTNAIAQELAKGSTKNIGVVVPHINHPFFSQIFEGILEKSFETDYKIIVLPSKYDEKLELNYLEQFRKKAFSAMIFTSLKLPEETILNYYKYGPIILCHKPLNPNLLASYTNRAIGYKEAFTWLKKNN